MTAEKSEWIPAQMCLALVKALSGAALTANPTIPKHIIQANNYPALRAYLNNILSSSVSPAAAAAQLHSRRQNSTESLRDYALIINSFAHQAYPYDPLQA